MLLYSSAIDVVRHVFTVVQLLLRIVMYDRYLFSYVVLKVILGPSH